MLIVGMAGFFDAFDALSIAFVLPVLIPLWHIETSAIGALISIGYVGQLIGATLLSGLAERYGRLQVLRWSIAIYAVSSLACAFSWSYGSLFALRFVISAGSGCL
jgi:putative MFS transporter